MLGKTILGCSVKVFGRSFNHVSCRNFCDVKEIKIPVPWGQMRGKQWGDPKKPFIVTLHGYMDNCNSFDRLIPLLPKTYCYVAVDWPGHGLSDHIPHGHFYSNEFYVWSIEKIRRYLGGPKIGIMSHSMAAGMALEYVQNILDVTFCLICFDTVIPPHNPMNARLHHIPRRVDEMIDKETWKERRRTREQFLDAMLTSAGYNGTINREDAEILIERGLEAVNGDMMRLRRDPKVQNNSVIGERDDLYHTPTPNYQNLHYCLMQFKAGMLHSPMSMFHRVMQDMITFYGPLEYHVLPGRHSDHLNNPKPVAEIVNKFLHKVSVECNL